MSPTTEAQERLLHALAEHLKLPFMQISRQAEAGETGSLESIRYISDMSLRLIDGYLLGTSLSAQEGLELEPVSVSSTLQDTAHHLSRLAAEYDCDLEVRLSGRYGPVMAHQNSLEAAFTLLGYSLIESRPQTGERHTILLGAHRSRGGIVAGIFMDDKRLTTDAFRRARALFGTARQPMPAITPGSSAGIYVADSILSGMSAPLHIARHNKLAGLAATLLPSQQMKLV
jgi:hypothetical protein